MVSDDEVMKEVGRVMWCIDALDVIKELRPPER